MSTAASAKSFRDECWFFVERSDDKFALCIPTRMGPFRLELTRAQAQALVERLGSELLGVQVPQPEPQEEGWRDPEIM